MEMVLLKNYFGFYTVLILLSALSLQAQVKTAPDSVVDQRNQVSKQIIQLRDTISVKIISVNDQLASTTPVNKPVAEKAARDLKFYQAQLEKGLDEIMTTKVWQADIQQRSTRLLSDMREKYKITEKELEKVGYH